MKTTIGGLLALILLAPALHAASLTVPGTSNPWLAGMPNGSIAIGDPQCSNCCDIAPEESPILFTPVVPGSSLSFEVTGSVNNDVGPSGLTPDGGHLQPHVPENGIAGFTGAINSLIGVFLDDSQPNLSPAPEDFPYLPNASTFAPGLKQVFFIGDGLTGTGSGAIQQFLVPVGATRLFLGTLDGCGWNNNVGEFVVEVDNDSVLVNDRVTFDPLPSTFTFTPDPSGCPEGFVGTFRFEAELTNISERSLTDLFIIVTTLTGGNLLQNTAGDPGGVGARLPVPHEDGFSDGVLSPEAFVKVPFVICLAERQPFTFEVDVRGAVE